MSPPSQSSSSSSLSLPSATINVKENQPEAINPCHDLNHSTTATSNHRPTTTTSNHEYPNTSMMITPSRRLMIETHHYPKVHQDEIMSIHHDTKNINKNNETIVTTSSDTSCISNNDDTLNNNSNSHKNQNPFQAFLATMTFAQPAVVPIRQQLQQQQDNYNDDDLNNPSSNTKSLLLLPPYRPNNDMSSTTTTTVSCDCEECGNSDGGIPPWFQEAIRRHKRQRRLPPRLSITPQEDEVHNSKDPSHTVGGTMKRTQHRRLLRRDHLTSSGISIWEWTLPLGAEPILEFGNSHRLIFVKSLSSNKLACIQSLGKGIVGSFDEERSRKEINWKLGGAYLIPSNGGKAVGWYHGIRPTNQMEPSSSTMSSSSSLSSSLSNTETMSFPPVQMGGGGHAVLYVFKIPTVPNDSYEKEEEEEKAVHPTNWVEMIRHVCFKALHRHDNEQSQHVNSHQRRHDNDKLVESENYFISLSEEETKLLRDLTIAITTNTTTTILTTHE